MLKRIEVDNTDANVMSYRGKKVICCTISKKSRLSPLDIVFYVLYSHTQRTLKKRQRTTTAKKTPNKQKLERCVCQGFVFNHFTLQLQHDIQ